MADGSELLERARELEELETLAQAACAGAGRLVVVEARAGLGKTRLLQAARVAGRTAGMRVLSARATELERDFPFALVRQLFTPADAREAMAPARGALGLAAEPAGDAFAVLHALYWLTAGLAEDTPLLLCVDDAHWADAASLDFLGFLVPRLEELPVLLAVACRPDEPGAERALARIATDGAAARLQPRALSADGTRALLAAELERAPDAAFAAACHEVSGGNPFLLCELTRTLAAEAVAPAAEETARVRELAPERVTRTVQVRLARLPPEARAVAEAVVVLGDGCDVALAAALAGLGEDDAARGADALRSAAILEQDAALRFIHPLVRTALHAELPFGARAAAHARAAALLAQRGAGPERLATHLVATEARGERATAETLLAAARAALASGAPRSASAYLTRALREPAPDDLRPAILDAIVTAGIRASDRALFEATLPAVLDELARDPELRRRRTIKVSMWMVLSGHARRAVTLIRDELRRAQEADDAEHAFQLEAQLGALRQRPLTTGREQLLRYADRLPPDSALSRLADALESEWHCYDGTATDAVAAARRALAHDGRIFLEQPELLAPGRPVLTLMLADELALARRAAEQALAHARRRHATPELFAALWMNMGVAHAFGDLAAAEADCRQALEVVRLGRLRLAEPAMRAALASLLLQRGEPDAAEAELEASGMTGAIDDRVWFAMALFPRGLLRLEQGRYDEAVADLEQLDRLSACWGAIGIPQTPAKITVVRALAAQGDHERAVAKAAVALAHARRFGAPANLSQALRAAALTVAAGERLTMLEESVAILDGSPARLARAEALVELGTALRRARRDVDARPPLREGLELARRCGATGLAKAAFDELAATGERGRRYTPIGAASLTPSQRRVAELAASGLTNRQIAQTLFLTVKTIESHLAAAYDGLGIRSRQELPAALTRDL
ncbi:helix-turn-helix transcriptional regulator [Conexibacter woesei]|uniref:helix-turn-helix transcriptional regulator n=1 Tax=Conexibacter woesei TaxID=191495 RepID=UPI0003FBA8DA|nr:LuxR family transcriptional regulator [Conexibacter woesei]